jgi:hypothetical protein
VAVITLAVVVVAIIADRKTKHIIEFADGSTAEIKRVSASTI